MTSRLNRHGFFCAIAETLNSPSYWIARQTGQTFSPVVLDIRLAEKFSPGSTALLTAGRQRKMDRLTLERIAPDRLRLRLTANDLLPVETPVMTVAGSASRAVCHAPWLYPPVALPYWRNFASDAERREHQTFFALEANGATVTEHSVWCWDATNFDPYVRPATADDSSVAWVEKLTRLDTPTRSTGTTPALR